MNCDNILTEVDILCCDILVRDLYNPNTYTHSISITIYMCLHFIYFLYIIMYYSLWLKNKSKLSKCLFYIVFLRKACLTLILA